MGIGAVNLFQPYIYQTNRLSPSSLEPIKPIKNDVSYSHISQIPEYEVENTNPLAKGETRNFEDVLLRQMNMGMQNAMRLFGEDSVFAGADF